MRKEERCLGSGGGIGRCLIPAFARRIERCAIEWTTIELRPCRNGRARDGKASAVIINQTRRNAIANAGAREGNHSRGLRTGSARGENPENHQLISNAVAAVFAGTHPTADHRGAYYNNYTAREQVPRLSHAPSIPHLVLMVK